MEVIFTPAEKTNLNTPKQTSKRLGDTKVDTLRHWRWAGTGPDYVRIGGRIFYTDGAIEAWIKSRTVAISKKGGVK